MKKRYFFLLILFFLTIAGAIYLWQSRSAAPDFKIASQKAVRWSKRTGEGVKTDITFSGKLQAPGYSTLNGKEAVLRGAAESNGERTYFIGDFFFQGERGSINILKGENTWVEKDGTFKKLITPLPKLFSVLEVNPDEIASIVSYLSDSAVKDSSSTNVGDKKIWLYQLDTRSADLPGNLEALQKLSSLNDGYIKLGLRQKNFAPIFFSIQLDIRTSDLQALFPSSGLQAINGKAEIKYSWEESFPPEEPF